MRRNRALSSSEYELIRARQRLLPLSADLAKQADRLIANSAVAAAFASNLDASLRSTVESRLAAAIFGGAGLEKPHRTASRQSRRMAAIRVRFATGQQSAATDSKDRKCFPVLWSDIEFEDVVRVLRDDPHLRKLLGRRPDIAPLLYSDELGSRRDAIAETDLLLVNAEALVVECVRVRMELIESLAVFYGSSRASVHRALNERNREVGVRRVNILYEVAWARYFGRPVIWYLPSRFGERDALIRAQEKIARTLRDLAGRNYVPLFKMQSLKVSQRFMPEDYRRLLADVPGPCVAGAMPLREQLLLALSDLSEFHSGKAAPTAAETRSFGRGHVG